MKTSRSYRKFAPKVLLAAWLFGLFSVVGSAGPNALSVNVGGGQLSASSSDPDTGSITIRVAGPGSFSSQTREADNQAVWTLPPGAPDGAYRYDVYASGAAGNTGSVDGAGDSANNYRVSGRFLVSGGAISTAAGDEETVSAASLLHDAGAVLLAIAGAAMPSAHAQDLTASSGVPTVNFDDTGLINGNIWDLFAQETNTNCLGTDSQNFQLNDRTSGASGAVMTFCAQGEHATPVPNKNSLIVDELGDMNLVDGSVFIDRSSGEVGIGTTTPDQEIHIVTPSYPFILLEETNGTTNAGVGFKNPSISIPRYIFLEPDADLNFANAMWLKNGSNYFGMGTSSPEVNLHVLDSGPAAVKVESTDTFSTADQVMFKLKSASSAKVRFSIKAGAAAWTFDNSPFLDEFSISRVGTGQNEFALKTNGDGTFRGNSYAVQHFNTSSRATKTDFAEVDVQGVLAGVLALPVSQWRYKSEEQDARHIGPVAEDFEAVFDLGDGKTISTVDATGIAFAAIQGLKREKDQQLAEKGHEIAALKSAQNAELAALRKTLAQQEERMLQLEMALVELTRSHTKEVRVSSSN